MEKIKEFLVSKSGKRALWTILNSVMALVVAGIAFFASGNSAWAITILPFAHAAAQWLTKYLNTKTE